MNRRENEPSDIGYGTGFNIDTFIRSMDLNCISCEESSLELLQDSWSANHHLSSATLLEAYGRFFFFFIST